MAFPYEDIRTFLDDCEKNKEAVRVNKEVDWNLEAGAITRRQAEIGKGLTVEKGGQPALLFEKVKGFPKGFRLASNLSSNMYRMALMMGHPDPENARLDELQEIFMDGYKNPIKPMLVSDGACKENKLLGKDIDLYKLPAPMVHDGDGGRYIGTYHIVATKDPDTEWVNWGMYRVLIHNKNNMGVLIVPLQNIGLIARKYAEKNEPMPVSVVIGADPLSLFMAATPAAVGFSEADVVGGLRKAPLKMVKCETNDLLVPADSEIVIEGEILPNVTAFEGPFGEYTGYRASPRDKRPVIKVTAITYRNDPILTMSCMGLPVDDSHILASIGTSAIIKDALKKVGIPVTAVNYIPESGSQLLVVSTKTPFAHIATWIKDAVYALGGMCAYFRYIFVVNDDVDIFNVNEVFHAFFSRIHPDRSIHVSRNPSGPLVPAAPLEERKMGTAPVILYDGTWPTDWHPFIAVPPKSSFDNIFPKDMQEKVLKNWKEYGLK